MAKQTTKRTTKTSKGATKSPAMPPVPKQMGKLSLGSLSFLFGASIAVIAGILSPDAPNPTLTALLVLLGIVVGLYNVTLKETNRFLLASVSLIIVTALGSAVLGSVQTIGPLLVSVLRSILTFIVPITLIVAIKEIVKLAESR